MADIEDMLSDSDYESGISHQSSDEEGSEQSDGRILASRLTILWLCQEGQIHVARRRFDLLLNSDEPRHAEQVQREVFQVGRDKNYALHEILMGGTSDRNAHALVLGILNYAKDYPAQNIEMLSAQPPSHRRTPLHWAVWSNANYEIISTLVRWNPEALFLRDKKNQGERTPIEILKRYFANGPGEANPDYHPIEADRRFIYLEKCAKSWASHRVRLTLHLCARSVFMLPSRCETNTQPTPFSKEDRKVWAIKPKPWFLLSVIGFLLQREMKMLALHIISFVGGNAKQTTSKKERKRKRNST